MPRPEKTRPSSRREFLRTTALAAAATTALPIARSAHAAAKQEIRIGMMGCGGRCSGAAAQALSLGKDVKLAGMVDVFQERMEAKKKWFKAQFPDQFIASDDACTHGLTGYKAVLAACDAVLIACASKYHCFYAEEAVKAGKHVFIEKPMAIDPAGCHRLRRVCEMAKQKNLSIVSGLESRYDVAYQEQVKQIHAGAIGKPVAIQSTFLRPAYQTVSRVAKLNEIEYQFSNWYHFRWLSGDDVTQSLVHNLDRMRWVLHEENPTWCFGLGGRSTSFGEVYGDMFDHHTVVYEFASGVRIYAMCQTRAGCYQSWDDVVLGSKGTCRWSACQIDGETKWRFRGNRNDSNLAEQERLIGSIRSGRPINDGATMIDSTRMAIMGQLACYSGKPVTWEQVAAADFEFTPKLAEVRLDMSSPIKPDAEGNYPLPRPGITDFF